jgi:hypothetical protein
MSLRRGIARGLEVGVILLAVMVVGPPIGEFLGGLHDAAWWDTLPWVLLAVFWAIVAPKAWRQFRERRAADGPG